jgi:hypothetical protein
MPLKSLALQSANGGLLNTPRAADVQQVPIFSPGLAVPRPFNMASMAKLAFNNLVFWSLFLILHLFYKKEKEK